MISSEQLDAAPSRHLGRSIGAVLAGALEVVLLSTLTDAAMQATGVFPKDESTMSNALFLLATTYRSIYGIAGSYIAARLAPRRPLFHAIILGFIGFALSTLGAVVTWNQAMGPHWYPLALVATALPFAWLGGKLARGKA